MDFGDVKFVFILLAIIVIGALAIGFCVWIGCETTAIVNAETMIIDVSESDILYDDTDFYILDPDGNNIPLGINNNEILDLTKHSQVLVKFKRYPACGIYGGSDWFVDGVVKTPNDVEE